MRSDSNTITRYLKPHIVSDLKRKMVFVGGPRQVGKTTMALDILDIANRRHPAYLNWDDPHARKQLLDAEFPGGQSLLVFDEIHKFPRWRNLVKGLYDTQGDTTSILVTGSASLDHFRNGGDSLQGRYHYYRLHPFTLNEISSIPTASDLSDLLQFGGFPEPLLAGDSRTWRRWQRERVSRVVYDDLRDLENVREVSLVALLAEALPDKVGSPLSINSLAEDLQVAHETVKRWLAILENLNFCFRIIPFGAPRIRAVKKEAKLYLWDWSQVPGKGERFENLVASHLLKYCHFVEDTMGFTMELRFIRDIDRREIDFVVLRDRQPEFAVECKTGSKSTSPSINYFRERTDISECFQVHLNDRDYFSNGTRVLPFTTFCREKGLP
ncbi:MAG: ATP-binding protein [Gammaproteobacteria bacterium]|nr:ATP-binding protein [Gammaproteobacteria bacterium]